MQYRDGAVEDATLLPELHSYSDTKAMLQATDNTIVASTIQQIEWPSST